MWKVLIDSVKKFLYLLLKKEFIINVRTPWMYRDFFIEIFCSIASQLDNTS